MSQTLQIIKNNKDISGKGVRESSKLLQQYLPDLTSSLLGSVIILGQGLPQKFTNNTPSGRKEVLEKLSKSDFMIEDLKSRVTARKSELQADQRKYEDKGLELTTQINMLSSQIEQSRKSLTSLDSDELHRSYIEKKEQSAEIEQKIQNLLQEDQETLESIHSLKEQEAELITTQSLELNNLKLKHETAALPHTTKLNEQNAQLSIYNQELRRIHNIKDVCPTCGQKISGVHKPETFELEHNICLLKDNISETTALIQQMTESYDRELKAIQDKHRDKKLSISTQLSQLNKRRFDIADELNDLRKLHKDVIAVASEIESKLSKLQASISMHQKIIFDNEEKLKVANDDILYNNMQKDLTKSHLDVVNKFDTALKRDFRGYLLSTVINYIEARAMQYCKVIFDTTNIGFSLDGNNIDISYMNKVYENLSGGEKQKIDLIIQFSIRDMLLHQLNFTSNILVLDEVFDGLDMLGCSKVIDMISNLSDVKNVFIVTHRKDLSMPSDKELVIVKSSAGISEIRYDI